MKKYILILLLLSLSACNMPGATPTVTPAPTSLPSATASQTLAPTQTFTPEPSATPTHTETPTIMPTIEPMIGTVRNNSNLRSQPSRGAGDRVGGIMYNQRVQVIGRNDIANWLYIIFPESPTGTAWITANAIDLQGDLTTLPIVIYPNDGDQPLMLPPIIYKVTGEPLPLNQPPAGAKTATVAQLSNVRVGPGVGYMSIGTLQPGAVVTLTGKIFQNHWVQIDYPSGIDGRGWLASALLKATDGYGDLPMYNILGTPETAAPTLDPNATLAPTNTPLPPTPTPAGPLGEATAQVNVRSGPAGTFDVIGMLNPKEKVIITGITLNGLWYQIEYAAGPNGRAWVSTQYIKPLGDMRKLRYTDNQGTPLPEP